MEQSEDERLSRSRSNEEELDPLICFIDAFKR